MLQRSQTGKSLDNLYMLPNALTKLRSKPPVESRERIEKVCDMSVVRPHDATGKFMRLITDGASLYPKMCSQYSLKHAACNHSDGVFCVRKRVKDKARWRTLLVHTGGLDGFWEHLKTFVPDSVSSRSRNVLLSYDRSFHAVAMGKRPSERTADAGDGQGSVN